MSKQLPTAILGTVFALSLMGPMIILQNPTLPLRDRATKAWPVSFNLIDARCVNKPAYDCNPNVYHSIFED